MSKCVGILAAVAVLPLSSAAQPARAVADAEKQYTFKSVFKVQQRRLLAHQTSFEQELRRGPKRSSVYRTEMLVIVAKGRSAGQTRFDCAVSRIRYEGELPGAGKVVVDTDSPAAAKDEKPNPHKEAILQGLAMYRQIKFQATLTPSRELTNLQGKGKLFEQLRKGAPPGGAEQAEKRMLGPYKDMLAMQWAYLPTRPTAVGGQWPVKRSTYAFPIITGTRAMPEEVTCRLAKVEKTEAGRIAEISLAGKIMAPGGLPTPARTPLQRTGRALFNLDAGRLVSLRLESNGKLPGWGNVKLVTELSVAEAPKAKPGKRAPKGGQADTNTVPKTSAPDPRPKAAGRGVRFVMHRVGRYRSEACCVGDFNKDGRLDIVAGPFLYVAPDWKARKIRAVKGKVDSEGKGYAWDFMNLPLDVDGDGLLDVVYCCWFGKCAAWFRNTGKAGGEWPETLIEKAGNFECGELHDIDGDGKAQEILPHVKPTVWYEAAKGPGGERTVRKHVVSKKPMGWGSGVGDVNGDGRPDVLRPQAWFEAPADPRKGKWKQHPLAVGHIQEGKADHTPQILVYDVNADGLNDIVTSSAHKYGIFWYQQLRKGRQVAWKQHVIDKSWTQAHSLALADLDNDGDLDLVTGKRFMAHNGNDPDGHGPLCVYWYELKRGRRPVWTKHAVSYKQGIGSGMNIPVVDLDKDGDLDIVVTGKWGGPVWFENKLK